jgi:adenylate cyclase class IV
MSDAYEIEIKSLLGGPENADRLRGAMKQLDPSVKKVSTHKQLNHYFENKDGAHADWNTIATALTNDDDKRTFIELASKAKDFSLRTREADGKVLLVFKAAIDDTTSANGTARREFEREVLLSLDALDALILRAGFSYQAKWSREREEYAFSDVSAGAAGRKANITIDKNAGYGYLAEFEVVENDPSRAEATKAWLRGIMQKLGVEELAQDRLGRMFAYYNAHWQEYYGTEKIFVID